MHTQIFSMIALLLGSSLSYAVSGPPLTTSQIIPSQSSVGIIAPGTPLISTTPAPQAETSMTPIPVPHAVPINSNSQVGPAVPIPPNSMTPIPMPTASSASAGTSGSSSASSGFGAPTGTISPSSGPF